MKPCYWILTLLCAVLFAAPSLAEEQSKKDLPWYEVEVIIFTRNLNAASFNEVWPSDPGLPDFANAQPLKWPAPAEQQPQSVANMLIPKDEYRLKTEFKRLRLSNAMQPVIHQAWRQPVTGLKKAKLFYLRTPESPATTEVMRGFENFAVAEPIKLEGTIRISVNRYLHVELDLLRRIEQSASYSSYEPSFGDMRTLQSQAYRLYRMQDTRRMRSGELHYIDHPLMGVLIKITPYKLPEPPLIKAVETAVIDNAITEQSTPAEGGAATAASEAAEPMVESDAQKPGVTTSVVVLPARGEE